MRLSKTLEDVLEKLIKKFEKKKNVQQQSKKLSYSSGQLFNEKILLLLFTLAPLLYSISFHVVKYT